MNTASSITAGPSASPSEFWGSAASTDGPSEGPTVGVGPTGGEPRRLPFDAPRNLDQRLAEVLAARNPFLEAAQSLLRALADMPDRLNEQGMPGWRAVLEEEVHTFTHLCDRANLRRDHMLGIR